MDYLEQAHLFLCKALQSSWDVVTKFDASVHNYDAVCVGFGVRQRYWPDYNRADQGI